MTGSLSVDKRRLAIGLACTVIRFLASLEGGGGVWEAGGRGVQGGGGGVRGQAPGPGRCRKRLAHTCLHTHTSQRWRRAGKT